MLKLMKYELRKTWFSKLMVLIVTGIAEVLFLSGIFGKNESLTTGGTALLVMISMFGIICVGLHSLLVLNKDLNTKQGYMIFMTPRSSYQILGAKIVENGLSTLLASLFFLGLAWIDITLAIREFGIKTNLIELIQEFLNELPVKVEFSFGGISVVFLGFVISWFATVVTAAFAIILSSMLLTGRRLNILMSLVIFFAISFAINFLSERIPYFDHYGYYLIRSLVELAIAAAIFLISSWIMEKKLSV